MGRTSRRLGKAKTVAVGCDQLPESFHGKEGVDGSSPSEGFAILPAQPSSSSSGLMPAGSFDAHAASTSVSAKVPKVCHYARLERKALILVVRGSFMSRLYSGDSTASSAIFPSALLWMPQP
jgi:hypothetical protein